MAVYFWMPDVTGPAGGMWASYRIVDHLHAAGITAAILHQQSGFRVDWFDNTTPIAYASETRVAERDLLVVSELDAATMLRRSRGIPKVILNQNHRWMMVNGHADYHHPDIVSVAVVSEDGVRAVEDAYGLTPQRLTLAVDSDLFRPTVKRNLVAFHGSKGAEARRRVLADCEALAGWETVSIADMSRPQVAEVLGVARVFLATSETEGFQLLAAEAMACEAAVVGYDGGGGREFITEDTAWPVPAGDVHGFVARVAEAADPDDRVKRGADLIRTTYTAAREAQDAAAIFGAAAELAAARPAGRGRRLSYPHPVAERLRRKVLHRS